MQLSRRTSHGASIKPDGITPKPRGSTAFRTCLGKRQMTHFIQTASRSGLTDVSLVAIHR